MFDDCEKWELIVVVHNTAKSLLIKAEEVDPDHEFYYPPLIQQRDALDHIIRAACAWLNPTELRKNPQGKPPNAAEYIERQMDKALGHAYRALFDAADWLSIVYRERIRETLSSYTTATIHAVLPDYHHVIEPRIEKICFEIAELRKGKDIGSAESITEGVQAYVKLIDELEAFLAKIRDARSKFDEVEFGQTAELSEE